MLAETGKTEYEVHDNEIVTTESELAERLRSLRRRRGWTLDQTSRASGVAASTLSKIENSLMSPTYDVLLRLASGLDVDVAELFASSQDHMGSGRRAISRSDQGKLHDTPLYEHRIVCAQLSHKKMMPFVTRIKKHEIDNDEGWSQHDGEEFVYVLSGSIQLHTEYYEPEILEAGDSFYIDSRMKHRVINHGAEDARVLWISTKVDVS